MHPMKKPYVVCHMLTSMDGRIVTTGWNLSPAGRAEYETTAATYQANAWICGRVTMAAFARDTAPVPPSAAPTLAKTDYTAPGDHTSYAIAIDASGKLLWANSDISGDHLITVLTEKVSASYLAFLQSRGVSYLFAGRDSIDLSIALDKLATRFQIKTLLLEGGGKINGAMLNAGLIDEISLLVAPLADGSIGTPTLFDVVGTVTFPPAGVHWKLLAVERRADDIVWLRYSVHTAA
jgi:2,5-diamino-6-(ribosylamino)-4(3H)-pyrimidinone 5'-phosphate reductase